MGYGKERAHIKKKIKSWGCSGFFGYGHGRAIRDFGHKPVETRSVCLQICPQGDVCRLEHHSKMDAQFPELAEIVGRTVMTAQHLGRPVAESVGAIMKIAEKRNLPGVERIRKTMNALKIVDITDHYVCGQLENIQNGLEGIAPDAPCSLLTKVVEEQSTGGTIDG